MCKYKLCAIGKREIELLKIENLHVEAGGREILKGVTLEVDEGKTCVLFGPNGSGKSTLLATIMGYDYCKVTKGRILFKGVDITSLPIDERARMGIGMMMQRPPNIVGVKLKDLVKVVSGNNNSVVEKADEFRMEDFLERDINVGFSGGEIKRSELLQLTAQRPQFILLDEPESGVDLGSIDLVGNKVRELLYGTSCRKRGADASALVITHTGQILDFIGADCAYILKDGRIACSGRPTDLLKEIREKGYKECGQCKMIKL
ncbi:MAG: ABC transporter ATP-binding protein [Methanomassiliicoccaceae archaeon]|nr:ABC transporter ATP-binding protein [Methanomassiliicoccaceae archaeon]